MDEPERDRIADLADDAADLLATMRREQLRRRTAGEDTGWLDQVVPELETLVDQAHDVQAATAIEQVVARHGPGPYPADELAAIAGVDLATLRRVLDDDR